MGLRPSVCFRGLKAPHESEPTMEDVGTRSPTARCIVRRLRSRVTRASHRSTNPGQCGFREVERAAANLNDEGAAFASSRHRLRRFTIVAHHDAGRCPGKHEREVAVRGKRVNPDAQVRGKTVREGHDVASAFTHVV